jgi:dihydrofolate reductase
MGKLIYSFQTSLDGYIAGRDGSFDALAPDAEVHAFHNEESRGIATHVYGRRLWEIMRVWETLGDEPGASAAVREFAAIWRGARKLVASRTRSQADVGASAELIAGDLLEELERLKAGEGDVSIGGATAAAEAIRAGLVDEYRLVVYPVVFGGGTPFFPDLGGPIALELLDTRRFGSGVVHSRYAAL